jgi:mono/diheme cytochrome c family protein
MNCFLKGVRAASVAAVVLAALFVTSAIVRGVSQRSSNARAKQVDELFNGNCARCHGSDGRGDTPQGKLFSTPDFTDPDWWKKNSSVTSTKSMRAIVTRGKAAMPAFGKKLSKAEINLLVDRVRKFRKLERKS